MHLRISRSTTPLLRYSHTAELTYLILYLTPVRDVNRRRRGRRRVTGPIGVCQRVFCGAPARWIEPEQAAQEAQQRGAASGSQSARQRVGVRVVGRAPPLDRGPVRQALRP